MTWTSPADLRGQVRRLWDRGDLLRDCVESSPTWPLRLTLKAPGAADLADRFESVRAWVRDIEGTRCVRIEWREWAHRVQGRQRLPAACWLDRLEDALSMVGETRAAQRFVALWARTDAAQPALLAWMRKRPLRALEFEPHWERLLAVVAWVQAHPRPNVYLRQVDVAGIDTKFIEAYRAVLAEWLDLALPASAVEPAASGVSGFARRYGFAEKPVRIRFRMLDPSLPILNGGGRASDITLDAASFVALGLPNRRVFITENETNFLAFPAVADAIVVFGAGYGWEALAGARWLERCQLLYWGDIDTHGFAILDQLRGHYPLVQSMLMDRATLLAHRDHWGVEADPARHALPRLDPEESALYDDLRFERLGPRVRLEQERVGYGWLRHQLLRLQATAPGAAGATGADEGNGRIA